MTGTGSLVLDAQPLIALLRDEPVAERVRRRIESAASAGQVLISAVNWSEVLAYATRTVGAYDTARFVGQLDLVPVRVVDVGAVLAGHAAAIRVEHRIGLGDSFAAALAILTGVPLLSGDADFRRLVEHGLALELVE